MGRAPCCDNNGLKKGPWTPEEDQKLVDYIHKHGYGNWRTLPKNAGLQRCGKSCRLRWSNYLKPDIKRGGFSFEEEETIIHLHSILGNKWSAIAARLPGRTDNEIKNYWNTHIRKKLLRMGIDPVTHTPRLDLLDLSSILGSQMSNITSRVFAVQQQQHIPLVNPELLKLVTSLMSSSSSSSSSSSHHHHHNNLYPQNDQNSHFGHTPQTQLLQNDHLLLRDQIQEFPTLEAVHDQWQSSNSGFTCSNNTTTNNTEDCYGPVLPAYHNPTSSSTSAYNNYGQEANFEFHTTAATMTTSVLSTPSSSPTTALNSNSTTTTTATAYLEDEPESYYCSDALKFELSDIWDVNYDFM